MCIGSSWMLHWRFTHWLDKWIISSLYFLIFFFWCGPFLKPLLSLLHYCFCFMFWIFGHEAYGILASGPGINPHPLTGTGTLNHWATREVPILSLNDQFYHFFQWWSSLCYSITFPSSCRNLPADLPLFLPWAVRIKATVGRRTAAQMGEWRAGRGC